MKPLPTITESNRLFARAAHLIPAGTQTLAKGPRQHVFGVAPKYLARGRGCRVWDVDENEYLDLDMGIGPLILGYANEAVDRAIVAQLADGITFSLMHPLEVEVAELVREVVPCAERVRFSKTGCDVTSAAVRLARAVTGRSKVLCCGYHGWHDWYVAVTSRSLGVPAEVAALTSTFEYNSLDSAAASVDDDTACVILEPMVFEAPQPGFLEGLRDLCTRRGALLIFDEMWTGFRLALGGAQQRFGVVPDLATFSKAIANGMPLSVLAGRAAIMDRLDRDVFFFTTFGGEALSLAAARATIGELRALDVPALLFRRGEALRAGIHEITEAHGIPWARCVGAGSRTMLTFAPSAVNPLLAKSFVQQELLRRGILWGGFHTLSLAHDDAAITAILDAYREVLPLLADVVRSDTLLLRLSGEPVEAVFRRTDGFNTKPAVKG